jgi:hypothetical protein
VTFYLDASVPIAVRTALASVREDIVYAGGPNAPKESTQDRHWLATVGREGWVVIKRDKRIRTRPWEREALIAAGAQTFCLTGAGNYNRWDTLRLLTARWARIEQVATNIPGPYIYSVTWEGVRELSLARGKTTTKSR